MGGEAKIIHFMLSRSEKLQCFLKPFLSVQQPQAFEVPLTAWSSTRGVSQELMWIRIFFSKLKKKSQALSCKKQEVQPSLSSGVLQLVPVLFEYNLLLHSPLPPNGTPVLDCHLIISLSRQTIGDLCPGNL